MTRAFLFSALLASFLAQPALAQTTEAEAPEANTETTAQNGLSLGEPVGPQPGDTFVAESHGDWQIRCIAVEEGQTEPCQLYQLLADDALNPVAEINIFDVPDDGQLIAGATIVTPLDTLLLPQLRLSIDGAQPRQYPFSFCQPVGCFVRIGLTEVDLQALRGGSAGRISIVPLPAPDQTVDLNISLTGFTAGFAALVARTAAP
ncbi:MAG: invasion protein IalB [Paracoccaceae bacterium]|jgi:invasion protein IalB